MKHTNLLRLLFAAFLGLFLANLAFAQAPGATPPASLGGITADNIVTWLTPIMAPLLIALTKKFVPSLPGFVLPILAPVFGVLLDLVNTYALHHSSNLLLAAVAGLAGVGIREVKDQLVPAQPPTP